MHTKRRINGWPALALILGLLALSLSNAHAQGRWAPLGPFGGPVDILAIDPGNPSVRYAAGNLGLYKTTDGGASWQPSHEGLPTVTFLRIDPQNPSRLYAGGFSGIYVSNNAGESWEKAGKLVQANDLLIHPAPSSTLFAGTGQGLFKSTDGGARWQRVKFLRKQAVAFIRIDPTNPNILYLGGYPQIFDKFGRARHFTAAPETALYKSADAGQTWRRISTGLRDALENEASIGSIAIDPQNPLTIYAGTRIFTTEKRLSPRGGATYSEASAQGVIKSIDGGESWAPANQGIEPNSEVFRQKGVPIQGISIDATNPQTLYAATGQYAAYTDYGIFKSSDGGAHWTAINQGLSASGGSLPHLLSLLISPGSLPTLLLGSDQGLFESSDGGSQWQSAKTEISGKLVYGLASDPSNPSRLLSSFDSGIHQSIDGGVSWRAVDSIPSQEGNPKDVGFIMTTPSLAFSVTQPSVVYSEFQTGLFEHVGLFRSLDGGSSWQAAQLKLPDTANTYNGIRSFAMDPTNPSTLYAGIDVEYLLAPNPLVTSQSTDLYRSDDAGDTWVAINRGLKSRGLGVQVQTIAVDPANPVTLYAGAFQGAFKSTNAGKSWRRAQHGLGNASVNSLVIDPSAPSRLYAGTSSGVFRSSNGGQSWRAANKGLNIREGIGLPNVMSIVLDPDNTSLMYISTSGGLFQSTSAGDQWTSINDGIDQNTLDLRLMLGHGPSKRLYAYAPQGGGVFVYQPE